MGDGDPSQRSIRHWKDVAMKVLEGAKKEIEVGMGTLPRGWPWFRCNPSAAPRTLDFPLDDGIPLQPHCR